MDPNATLRRWRDAKKDGDFSEAREARSDLREWIRKGGFLPSGLTRRERLELGLSNPKGSKLRAEKIRLNRQGYTSGGRYYGVGAPLYRVTSDDGELDEVVRAPNAKSAKEQALIPAWKRNPCVNPRRHFPRTPRGRPPVSRSWSLEIYDASGGPKIGTKKVSTNQQDAYNQAAKMVGKKYKGKVVHKVILDGPK
jgi:hypothetical protein